MTDTKNWHALEIVVEPAAAEAMEFALNELEALGTEINNLGKKNAVSLTVIGYFNDRPGEAETLAALGDALDIYGLPGSALLSRNWREVEDQDWLAEWKKHWKPTETDRFIVAPHWETIGETDKIVIRIEPSMAFGTGTHETTRLCLRAIERDLRDGESFFDVGTGTGILAIAAAKQQKRLGGTGPAIVGCDTDADSVRIAAENTELNEEPGIELYIGSIEPETPAFDFVCANLTADVIIPILPLLVEKARRILVLSGILREQEDSVTDVLKRIGANDFEVSIDGEWIGIVVRR